MQGVGVAQEPVNLQELPNGHLHFRGPQCHCSVGHPLHHTGDTLKVREPFHFKVDIVTPPETASQIAPCLTRS